MCSSLYRLGCLVPRVSDRISFAAGTIFGFLEGRNTGQRNCDWQLAKIGDTALKLNVDALPQIIDLINYVQPTALSARSPIC